MRPRSTVASPASGNRKSLTPSSSRTTPDPNRKSYSSGQSLSSATSYASSVRNSASLSARLSQNLNSSRLPTPKPRIDTQNTAPLDIEVPPVPAIPKAYESPGSEFDQPFFSARSSSLPPVDSPITASPHVTNFETAMKALETPRAPSTASRLSSSFVGSEQDTRQKPVPKNSKKSNPALRLPPLNLLPLSTPTAAKIRAFKESRAEAAEGPSTPPPHRGAKTPSTPMTASKASFFSRNQRTADEAFMRSSTSHHAMRPTSMVAKDDSPSLPVFTFESDSVNDRGISPFISSSLPKNDDLANYMRPNFHTELNRTTQPKPNGPRAPSFSINQKLALEPSPVEKSGSESSGYNLRRKLSKPKNDLPQTQKPQPHAVDKYDNMPPPKLPASATWTNNLSAGGSPAQKPTTYLRSRRQTSGSSITLHSQRQDSIDSTGTPASTSRPSMESVRSFMQHPNRSGSLTNGQSQSRPQPKPQPQAQPQVQETVLDRDDMLAEEEMKKLASKRRDFESAARELDALRARACPARRIAASTATQVHNLNIFERGEVVDYPDVFFCGTSRARKIVGDPGNTATNFGYDDDRGDYNIVEGDHLAYRYEVVDLLGKGSFGQVVRCIDHKTGILVAVKIIRNKKRFHQQALVEVNILQKLKEWVSTNTADEASELTGP
jgi:dual specificity tyrosine-phosphorylation-regulated kinase 2/3/4